MTFKKVIVTLLKVETLAKGELEKYQKIHS